MSTASTCCTGAATSRYLRPGTKHSTARKRSSIAPFGSRRFPDGLEAASDIAHSKCGIRRCPIEKEAQGGKGKSGDREQAVRLPHQKVWMAMEGDGEDRGRSARGEVPHLRRDAHGPGLRVAHPVGGVGERMGAPGRAEVQRSLQVGPTV